MFLQRMRISRCLVSVLNISDMASVSMFLILLSDFACCRQVLKERGMMDAKIDVSSEVYVSFFLCVYCHVLTMRCLEGNDGCYGRRECSVLRCLCCVRAVLVLCYMRCLEGMMDVRADVQWVLSTALGKNIQFLSQFCNSLMRQWLWTVPFLLKDFCCETNWIFDSDPTILSFQRFCRE